MYLQMLRIMISKPRHPEGEAEQGQMLCLHGGMCARYFEEILTSPGMRRLLATAKCPWPPLIWAEAKCLEDRSLSECLLRDPVEARTPETVAKVGQAAQVLFWRQLCVKATKQKCDRWLAEDTKPLMDVKAQVDEWLHARGLLGLLSFEEVDEENENVLRYKFREAGPGPGSSGPGPGEKPSRVYHGTWWHALRIACVAGGWVL